jgi:hypothetical protein
MDVDPATLVWTLRVLWPMSFMATRSGMPPGSCCELLFGTEREAAAQFQRILLAGIFLAIVVLFTVALVFAYP